MKRTEHKSPCYLENDELKAILDSVDVNSQNGLRDKALFIFLYNTGARVQETVDVKIEDLKLDAPGKVKLVGKGKKEKGRRNVPVRYGQKLLMLSKITSNIVNLIIRMKNMFFLTLMENQLLALVYDISFKNIQKRHHKSVLR